MFSILQCFLFYIKRLDILLIKKMPELSFDKINSLLSQNVVKLIK